MIEMPYSDETPESSFLETASVDALALLALGLFSPSFDNTNWLQVKQVVTGLKIHPISAQPPKENN